MKPPFSYHGGKQRMAPNIVPLLPPHTVYVEPFCGSAAIMFDKGIPPYAANNNYIEVINDLDDRIVNFFRVLQVSEQRNQLIERLDATLYSRSEFKRALGLIKKPVDDPALMAWAWFVQVQMSFTRVGRAWGTSVMSNEASKFRNSVERISEYQDRLRHVHVEQKPAVDVIEKWDSPQTLHYCDPPYPGTDQDHYGGFKQCDFERLVDALEACRGAVVLSCYDNPAVPAGWEKHEFKAMASSKGITGANRDHSRASTARSDAGRTECVWIKPASGEVRPELKAAMIRHAAQRRQLSLFEEASA